MSYTKTVWSTGDPITPQKLNKIENQLEANQLPEVTTADWGKTLDVDWDWDHGAYTVIVPTQTVVVSAENSMDSWVVDGVTYYSVEVTYSTDLTWLANFSVDEQSMFVGTLTVNGEVYNDMGTDGTEIWSNTYSTISFDWYHNTNTSRLAEPEAFSTHLCMNAPAGTYSNVSLTFYVPAAKWVLSRPINLPMV